MTEIVPVTLVDEVAQYGPTRRINVLVASWLASFNSFHTQRAYARDMKMWLQFCDEKELDPLRALRAHIDLWKQVGAGYREPKNTSLARRLCAVSSWYEYLVEEDVLDRNPAAHVKRPHVDPYHTDTRGLNEAESRAMMTAAVEEGWRDAVVVTMLLLGGLRCSELVMADVEHLGRERGYRTIDVTRKGGTIQRLPLTEPSVAAIEAYLDDRGSGPLVQTETGKRISPFQVYRLVQKIARKAGIPDPDEVTPHSLRHAFVTLSLEAGAPIEDVQRSVGHRDPKTTIRYNHSRRDLEKNSTHKLTEHLLGKDEEAAS